MKDNQKTIISDRAFENRIQKVFKANPELEGKRTVSDCNTINRWTPIDLIIREYLNNGGGSAPGFLGMTRRQCYECMDYIRANKKELIKADLINADGCNTAGIPLWNHYNF